jgi:hypothetical protein
VEGHAYIGMGVLRVMAGPDCSVCPEMKGIHSWGRGGPEDGDFLLCWSSEVRPMRFADDASDGREMIASGVSPRLFRGLIALEPVTAWRGLDSDHLA